VASSDYVRFPKWPFALLVVVALVPGVLSRSAAAAPRSHTVQDGSARFEVLTPTLIRLEYAGDDHFEDRPTFNVISRDLPTPRFTTDVRDGWREIRTDQLLLRYKQGSGPFTPDNTTVTLAGTTARPSWPEPPGSCTFGGVCQAEDGRLSGGESVNYDHTGFTGRGFTADYGQVTAADTWTLTGAPGGNSQLQVRYANGGTVNRTLSVQADGTTVGQATLPPTGNWDSWSVATVPLPAGTTTVGTLCGSGDGCNVNLDSIAVTTPGAPFPSAAPEPPVTEPGQLGGWTRGLDSYTNQAGTNVNDVQLHPGILNRQGWSLLDDTYTAVRTSDGWATPRPDHDGMPYQDGYFFGYGHNYQQALHDLRAITGPADMLPEWAFGVWFSRYFAYTTSDYENQLIPAFRANDVPLDALVADTDWKSPQTWDGWNWNPALFPDPQAFLGWAKQQGLNVTLNVHAGIDASDPNFAQAQQTAQGGLQRAAQCFSPQCYRFDWSDPAQAQAWFDLHHPFEQQGVRQWWLDWCCTDSVVDLPGLTPDSWINEQYAKHTDARGLRGFVLARVGSSFEDYQGAPASGPWGEHRSTVHFTGDTDPTWDSLAFEAQMSSAEASIGQPYVSHDIGSFKGRHLPDDLYARWVQFGAFQPILRLHSDHGDRLPWDYGAGQQPAADFLRLREALLPYTYTLASQATQTGLPITRPLYLDYPDQDAAYTHPTEYLYGPDVLVAPVTSPGRVATQTVWFPPGHWTDYFTGASYVGPSTATLWVPLSRMPVFVKDGGIIPEQPGTSHAGGPTSEPFTLKVFAGADGDFSLYSDAGEGLGYQKGQSSTTQLSYRSNNRLSSLRIGAADGSYPGAPSGREYQLDLVDTSKPQGVLLNGQPLSAGAWSYDPATATLRVRTGNLPTDRAATITQIGGQPVQRAQSAAVALTLDPSTPTTLDAGASTQVTGTISNAGPGAITGVHATLSAPQGWTVSPAGPTAVADVPAGASADVTWNVTSSQQGTAALKASVTYTSASNGSPGQEVTSQGPPALVPPVIASLSPTSAAAGQQVTIHGSNFGATQGSSYVFFVDGGTSWGAPFDGATFQVNSWSDTAITFTVPTPSGPNGIWHVTPGDTATVQVTTPGGSSASVPLAITG
jgi:hypothetical protein